MEVIKMPIASAFQCVNSCLIFETVGVPAYCPHCGSREVYETDESVTKYETMDEQYVNKHSATVGDTNSTG